LVKSNALSSAGQTPQLYSQPIDRAGAVGGQVRAVCSEHPKLGDHLVVELELAQVPAHAALIGDDRRVLGVGLSLAAVGIGGAVHSHTGQIPDTLAPPQQQRQYKRGRTVGKVNCPRHLHRATQDRGDDRLEVGLVVGDPPRQQAAPVPVDDHDMVMPLAGVDPGPRIFGLLHPVPLALVDVVAVDVLAVRSLRSDRSRRSQSAVKPSPGTGWPIKRSHRGQKTESHARSRWRPGPYGSPDHQEGREN